MKPHLARVSHDPEVGGVGRAGRAGLAEASLMERVIIAGDGLRLTLGVGDYEQQDARGDDANWLRGQIELELTGAAASSFRARCSVAWTTDDLVRFHESLRTLLDDLTGTARLTTLEDQIELTIVLKGGNGTISGRVEEHALVRTEFEDIPTDQSQLKMGLLALRRVIQMYPPRP
jgi:hypothetical protein